MNSQPGDQLSQYYNSPDIQAARDQAQQAQQTAVNYQSAAGLLPTKLREAIQGKLDYNKDIIDQQNKAQANYFAAPATARSDYQNIFNPFDREKLVSQAVANAYAPYASLTDILGQRRGAINDIVGAGTGAFQAQVGAQQGSAQIAQQAYSDQMALADKLSNIAQWSYEQTHKNTGGSGGSDLSGLANILPLIMGQNNQEQQSVPQPTEPKPTSSPAAGSDLFGRPKNNTGILYHSSGGQWIFDWQTGDWTPVVD